ncbi:cysteine dioxygenase [Pseudomonas brassicacearum]|uniref:cysteine dioxygenase family protein n=1 Tax=Pseudomonas brassicacearum TaxID=930166 RepID=UPI000F48560B|nr:cysteine dioxygenase [Pseudomonas brassicacearum]ROM61775.1 cysteine dioxygenase [Pseudomonas brassicacearum]
MSIFNRPDVIEAFLQKVRVIHQRGVDRAALGEIVGLLEDLAERRDLFNFDTFPAPVPGQGSTAFRYRLNDDGDTPTLYLNSLLPGKSTIPHNHETWAIISAVEGQEINYVYRRDDEGREPGYTTLHLENEVIVQPGTSIAFLGEDLHGIRVAGAQPTLHFHLYGLPLESLNGRYGVEADGRILNYNASQMAPSIKAYAH